MHVVQVRGSRATWPGRRGGDRSRGCGRAVAYCGCLRSRGRHEGRGGGSRRGDVSAAALGTPVRIFPRDGGWSRSRGTRAALVASPGLVSVVGVLALVALFFLFGEELPLVFALLGLVAPLLADDFGDFRVGESGVLLDYLGLVVLAVKNEGWGRFNHC